MSKAVRVLGIDPGTQRTGFGVIEVAGGEFTYLDSGIVRTNAQDAMALRLAEIYRGLEEIIAAFQPTTLAIEEVFVAKNPSSAIKLGQARGVAIAAAVAGGLEVHEYAARHVKRAIVGTGKAQKNQMQAMVTHILGLPGTPREDAADALALAICHVNTLRL